MTCEYNEPCSNQLISAESDELLENFLTVMFNQGKAYCPHSITMALEAALFMACLRAAGGDPDNVRQLALRHAAGIVKNLDLFLDAARGAAAESEVAGHA